MTSPIVGLIAYKLDQHNMQAVKALGLTKPSDYLKVLTLMLAANISTAAKVDSHDAVVEGICEALRNLVAENYQSLTAMGVIPRVPQKPLYSREVPTR